jgi:hypothetical protein
VAGPPIYASNYRAAIDVADALIADLRAILNGNGLGKFEGTPTCSHWFSSALTARAGSGAAGHTGRAAAPSGSATGGDPKRQKTQNGSSDADRNGRTPPDPDLDRKKALGIIQFDPAVAGTTRLPNINVYYKKRGAKTPERLCIKFLTRGFACGQANCKLPHLTNVDVLPQADRTKLVEFVRKQPGLSWVEGKAPAGTS